MFLQFYILGYPGIIGDQGFKGTAGKPGNPGLPGLSVRIYTNLILLF